MNHKRRRIVILIVLSLLGLITFAFAYRVLAAGTIGAVAGY